MLFQLLCTIQFLITFTTSQRVLQQVTLSPLQPSTYNAHVFTHITEVQPTNDLWAVDLQSDSSWQFIIFADQSWGFDPIKPSTISLTINSPFLQTSDLLFGITTNNQQYISMSVPVDNTKRHTLIYPGCSTYTIGTGDIASLPKTNRNCDIADGSCYNWQPTPFNTQNIITQPPITITLENNPPENTLYIYLSTADYTLPIQNKCAFSIFPYNVGLKMYIGGNDPGQMFLISNFELKSTIRSYSHPFNTLPPPQPITPVTAQPIPILPVTAQPIPILPVTAQPIHILPTLPTLPNIPGPPAHIQMQMTTTTTTSTTIPPEPTPGPGQELGAFDQICDSASLSSLCADPLIDMAIAEYGNMQCEGDYSCCLCKSIECGNQQFPCNRFSAGAQGVFGVRDITIKGNTFTGSIINCFGFEGCSYSVINAENIAMVQAGDDLSLANAMLKIENPLPGFTLDCSGGVGGCADLDIELVIPGPPAGYECNPELGRHLINFNEIKCGTQESCKDMRFTFRNEGCNPVVISSLDCLQSDSCNGATFNFIGDISISKCGFEGAGNGVTGIDKCFENLDTFSCPDSTSCNNAIRTLTNPVNGFGLICGNSVSCEGLQLTINVNSESIQPIQWFDSFKFSGVSSGANAIITINNSQVHAELYIAKVECASAQSCENMTIYLGNMVSIGEIICAYNACNGCMIKRTFNNEVVPCQSNNYN